VDNVFEAVDGDNFALAPLVAAALDDNLVVLAEGDRADLWDVCQYGCVGLLVSFVSSYVVLLSEFYISLA
jgi:hypothetical protein